MFAPPGYRDSHLEAVTVKQSLQLKVSQQLTMTPQLQQAIRLLQLSTLDLQQEIEQTLEANPLIEREEDDGGTADKTADGDNSDSANTDANSSAERADEPTDSSDSDWGDDIPAELSIDSSWDDIYPTAGAAGSGQRNNDAPLQDMDSRFSQGDSLQDHLLWQINLGRYSDTDLSIAMAIIDAVDDKGRLTLSLEDIHEGFVDSDVELDEVEAVLHRVQQLDPPGIAARDLRECMLIQLRQLPENTPYRAESIELISEHIELLGSHDYTQLLRRSQLDEEQLKAVIALLRQLDPTPGESIAADKTEYVVPDVFVSKIEDEWRVELNPSVAPKLRINSHYASLARSCNNARDNAYIRDNLQEAKWFLKSLQSRNETLLKVARTIVDLQKGFLDFGEEAMKPMVLHDIAEAVEMHESTISRVTTQKYMHTPRGIFELKYFFSSHVSTSSGGECSSTAIRALIKKLIAAENPRKPLSDSKITALLAEQGIKVARRTIAKYRESMQVPPSNERKRLV